MIVSFVGGTLAFSTLLSLAAGWTAMVIGSTCFVGKPCFSGTLMVGAAAGGAASFLGEGVFLPWSRWLWLNFRGTDSLALVALSLVSVFSIFIVSFFGDGGFGLGGSTFLGEGGFGFGGSFFGDGSLGLGLGLASGGASSFKVRIRAEGGSTFPFRSLLDSFFEGAISVILFFFGSPLIGPVLPLSQKVFISPFPCTKAIIHLCRII